MDTEKDLNTAMVRAYRHTQHVHVKNMEERIREITGNYYLRGLSGYVSMFGMYSRFIIGTAHTFFVFGYRKDLFGPHAQWLESDDMSAIFPEQYVRKAGYMMPLSWTDGFGFDWNQYAIDPARPEASLNAIMGYIADLEVMKEEYKKCNVPVPEYCIAPGGRAYFMSVMMPQKQANEMAHHARRGFGLSHLEKRLMEPMTQILQDISIPVWPMLPNMIRKTSDLPGELAFFLTVYAMAMKQARDEDYILNVRRHPSSWNREFFALGDAIVRSNLDYPILLPSTLAPGIERSLKALSIPYRLQTGKSSDLLLSDLERTLTGSFDAKQDNLGGYLHNEYAELRVPSVLGGYVYYLIRDAETRELSMPLRNRGIGMLYSQAPTMNLPGGHCPAVFTFCVPSVYRNDFFKFCLHNRIDLGYLPQQCCTGESGLHFVTEIYNMPLVQKFLKVMVTARGTYHETGIDHDSTYETRTPLKDVKTIYGNKCCSMGFESMTYNALHGGQQKTDIIDADTGKVQHAKTSSDFFLHLQWQFPMEAYVQRTGIDHGTIYGSRHREAPYWTQEYGHDKK